MTTPDRIHIPFGAAFSMVANYIKSKLLEQIKAVAFVVIYLFAFKLLILNEAPMHALQISFGIGLVVLGLAVFLEGLFLGLMPLGERVGIQLPQKTNIYVITAFGLLIGFCSTLAEPSISTLQHAGATVTPWGTPLLFRFLEVESTKLVYAVCTGVSIAVAAGMIRFYFGLAMKPFIYVLYLLTIGMTAWFACDPSLSQILNLAWDTGGVTTGPVTVPLVLALGIGISKVSKHQSSGPSSGFGVITMASILPIISVMIVGAWLNSTTAKPVTPEEFFSPAYRQEAKKLVPTEEELLSMSFTRGNENARKAYFQDDNKYKEALISLINADSRKKLLGDMPIYQWLSDRASSKERTIIALGTAGKKLEADDIETDIKGVFKEETQGALKAVIPLVLLLLTVLVGMLRSKPKHTDEVTMGIIFAVIGLAVLSSGLRLGFSPLGDQVGRPLPQVFKSETHEEGRIILEPFDERSVITAYTMDGLKTRQIYIKDPKGNLKAVKYDPSRYNKAEGRYEHIVEKPSRFRPEMTLVGIALVFLFAFGLGFGSTVAEPALNALGSTVEDITVGTVKRKGVVMTVSLGVGIGMMTGVARILYNIPVVWLLVPGYLTLLILTHYVDDDFAGIAWDAGGVTTGPITVPLVIAMGLGISGGLNISDGFGIIAMASLFPVMTMLAYGVYAKIQQSRLLSTLNQEESND